MLDDSCVTRAFFGGLREKEVARVDFHHNYLGTSPGSSQRGEFSHILVSRGQITPLPRRNSLINAHNRSFRSVSR